MCLLYMDPMSVMFILFCQGTEIWSSPVQPAPLVNLVTYPQWQLVVTVDTQGLIKVWNAETGCECASFSLLTYSSVMETCDHPQGLFLLVSDLAFCRVWPPPWVWTLAL
jgi:hypothetical protein